MSGSSGVNRQVISPNEPGLGQGMTRQSLPNTDTVPGAPTPSANRSGSSWINEPDPIVSPNERGMGQGMTRESLTNPDRAGSGSSSGSASGQRMGQSQMDSQTRSPNERGMGQGMTGQSLSNPSGTRR